MLQIAKMKQRTDYKGHRQEVENTDIQWSPVSIVGIQAKLLWPCANGYQYA